MATRSEMDAQLAELYAQIPRIPDCDGRCWTSCGPVAIWEPVDLSPGR